MALPSGVHELVHEARRLNADLVELSAGPPAPAEIEALGRRVAQWDVIRELLDQVGAAGSPTQAAQCRVDLEWNTAHDVDALESLVTERETWERRLTMTRAMRDIVEAGLDALRQELPAADARRLDQLRAG